MFLVSISCMFINPPRHRMYISNAGVIFKKRKKRSLLASTAERSSDRASTIPVFGCPHLSVETGSLCMTLVFLIIRFNTRPARLEEWSRLFSIYFRSDRDSVRITMSSANRKRKIYKPLILIPLDSIECFKDDFRSIGK